VPAHLLQGSLRDSDSFLRDLKKSSQAGKRAGATSQGQLGRKAPERAATLPHAVVLTRCQADCCRWVAAGLVKSLTPAHTC
jgi:hypothetical protein